MKERAVLKQHDGYRILSFPHEHSMGDEPYCLIIMECERVLFQQSTFVSHSDAYRYALEFIGEYKDKFTRLIKLNEGESPEAVEILRRLKEMES